MQDFKTTSTKHLDSFTAYHRVREHLPEVIIPAGTKCYLERNARTPLIEATLLDYTITSIPNDYSGVGKYMNRESFANVQYEKFGKLISEPWPLTMIYFDR